jgi:hypothetical protein
LIGSVRLQFNENYTLNAQQDDFQQIFAWPRHFLDHGFGPDRIEVGQTWDLDRGVSLCHHNDLFFFACQCCLNSGNRACSDNI